MGLLAYQPQIQPRLPSMPGGLPTFTGQQPPGPRAMGGVMGMPPTQGMPQPTGGQHQINLNIPQYGHGYEGSSMLGSIPQPVSQAFNFSRIGNMTNLGPNSLAPPPTYGADFPMIGNGGQMNGESPVTWYAQDWQRMLPK